MARPLRALEADKRVARRRGGRALPLGREPPRALPPARRALPMLNLALVTSAGAYIDGTEPFDTDRLGGDASFREIPIEVEAQDLKWSARGYDPAAVHEDMNAQVPIDAPQGVRGQRHHRPAQPGLLEPLRLHPERGALRRDDAPRNSSSASGATRCRPRCSSPPRASATRRCRSPRARIEVGGHPDDDARRRPRSGRDRRARRAPPTTRASSAASSASPTGPSTSAASSTKPSASSSPSTSPASATSSSPSTPKSKWRAARDKSKGEEVKG